MSLKWQVCLFLQILARVDTQWGNGITAECAQQILCGPGCVNAVTYNSFSELEFAAVCYQCGPDRYKSTTGQTPCSACPERSSASSCITCNSSTECACDAGYTSLNGNQCTSCFHGTYKSIVGNGLCIECPTGKYSDELTGIHTLCVDCGRGYYQDQIGQTSCIACPVATFSDVAYGSTTCVMCPADSGMNCAVGPDQFAQQFTGCTDLSHCRCNNGYYGPNNTACTPCPLGSGDKCGDELVLGCPTVESCACNGGHYGVAGYECTICPDDSTESCIWDICTSLQHCYGGCNAGQYGLGYAWNVWFNGGCSDCPTNSGENCLGVPGSICANPGDCRCNTGYVGPSGGPCVSNSVVSSVCDPGYASPDGGECTACAAGKYKETTGSVACAECPVNSGAVCVGCTALADCDCDAGFGYSLE
jgi:hypothetical protein